MKCVVRALSAASFPRCLHPRRLTHIAVTGLASISFLLAAGPASAAPSLEVKLSDDANEIQWVQIGAATGQFRLSFGAGGSGISETADISVPATAAQIQNALNGLANISAGGGSVTVNGLTSSGAYTVAFDGGPLSHSDVPLLVAAPGTEPLGGDAGSTILIRTIHPAGVSRSDEQVDYTATVTNTGADPTSGEVALEVELPGGLQTSVLAVSGNGWICGKSPASAEAPAKAVCGRSSPLSASASYPPVTVAAALGADAPDRAVATVKASCQCAPAPAAASDEFVFSPAVPFGVQSAEAGFFDPPGAPFGGAYTQAGGHPFLGAASLLLTSKRRLLAFETGPLSGYAPSGQLKEAIVDLPRGEVGNLLAPPELCSATGNLTACPAGSVVGAISLDAREGSLRDLPIVAIEPEFGTPAQFAFEAFGNRYTLSADLRPGDRYGTSLELAPIPMVGLLAIRVGLCDFGAVLSAGAVVGCRDAGDPAANPKPLFTNPTRCDVANSPRVVVRFNSWERPDPFAESAIPLPALTGCELVSFEPEARVTPSGRRADSPTGLDVELKVPTFGLESNTGIAQANLDDVDIALPPGMSINAAAADGLGACGKPQIGLGTNADVGCPDSAKIGTAELETPLVGETLTGPVYVAAQREVSGSTIGFYLVFESKRYGILVKVPARVTPNPRTGQLVIAVDESPEIPFSALRVHLAAGPRAVLVSPPRCGQYETKSAMTPWTAVEPDNPTAAETVTQTTGYGVSEGPGGGPCPTGALDLKVRVGTENSAAGAASPLSLGMSREDGTDRFTAFDLAFPPGLGAYLKGVPYCPDTALASISSAEGAGRTELDEPVCPAESKIGVASIGAGAGPNPLFLETGRVYLAGPYKGAPLSIAIVVPAVVGPLDLGNVLVRSAVHIDPATARITIESDPVPTILNGILLDIREIRVRIDRPGFTFNPTNCEPLSISAGITGELAAPVAVSRRFQAAGCENLPFKPKLRLGLVGGTGRNGHPALTATLTQPPGQAGIRSLSLTLPRSELLAQEHIRAVCTRSQFASHVCPARSIYGHAEAETPLLDQPLSGPVYLRASDHKLPDLVMALRGPASQPIEIDLVGRVDSANGRIRNSFEAVPDAPISRLVLKMQGGKKGLLVNSHDLCAKPSRATVRLVGQNGKRADQFPAVHSHCGKRTKNNRLPAWFYPFGQPNFPVRR